MVNANICQPMVIGVLFTNFQLASSSEAKLECGTWRWQWKGQGRDGQPIKPDLLELGCSAILHGCQPRDGLNRPTCFHSAGLSWVTSHVSPGQAPAVTRLSVLEPSTALRGLCLSWQLWNWHIHSDTAATRCQDTECCLDGACGCMCLQHRGPLLSPAPLVSQPLSSHNVLGFRGALGTSFSLRCTSSAQGTDPGCHMLYPWSISVPSSQPRAANTGYRP